MESGSRDRRLLIDDRGLGGAYYASGTESVLAPPANPPLKASRGLSLRCIQGRSSQG